MKRTISLIIVFTILAVPVFAFAQDSETACAQAKADAKRDSQWWLWTGAGCLINIIGVGLAYLLKPAPPPERLLGKPSDYVTAYTDCYVKEARKDRAGKAWIGCGVAGGVALIGTVILVIAAQEAGQSCGESCGDAIGTALGNACSNSINCNTGW
jgi:hypothetical protein